MRVQLQAIIFDVDGTLAETEERHRLSFNAAFAEAGLPWVWDRPLYARLLRVAGGKERLRRFFEEAREPEAAAAITRIEALHARKTELYTAAVLSGDVALRPGIAELIAEGEARGLGLAIATTTTRANVDALLASTLGADALGRFRAIVCAEDAPNKKPAPDVYIEALRRLELPAEAAIALEDSENGVLSAKAAGLRVIALPSHYLSEDDFSGADVVLETAEAAPAWLGWRPAIAE